MSEHDDVDAGKATFCSRARLLGAFGSDEQLLALADLACELASSGTLGSYIDISVSKCHLGVQQNYYLVLEAAAAELCPANAETLDAEAQRLRALVDNADFGPSGIPD